EEQSMMKHTGLSRCAPSGGPRACNGSCFIHAILILVVCILAGCQTTRSPEPEAGVDEKGPLPQAYHRIELLPVLFAGRGRIDLSQGQQRINELSAGIGDRVAKFAHEEL